MLSQEIHLSLPCCARSRFFRSCLLLLTVFGCMTESPAVAQETFVQPASRLITTFPFTVFTGGVILLRAKLNDFPDSLNFILDTGSGGISLDSETCVRLRMTPLPSDKTILGIAGVRQVKILYKPVLHLPGLTVDSPHFHVHHYYIPTTVYRETGQCIIGSNFLFPFT